jgi:predicted  nucleic acid-binding Zn-ribbon protein
MSDASVLLELAQADYLILRIKKQLDELPQLARLLELRTKKAEVDAKAEQVAKMRHEGERTIKALADEEETLRDRLAKAQNKRDNTINYKEASAYNKEIEGFIKRMEKIEFDSLKQMEKLDKIAQVEGQVNAALARLQKQDAEQMAAYKTQAGALKREMQEASDLREGLEKKLPPDLITRYDKACKAKGGRGAAHIEGTHCSGCRVEITEGQLEKLKSGAQIGECPHCHRLLVVGT